MCVGVGSTSTMGHTYSLIPGISFYNNIPLFMYNSINKRHQNLISYTSCNQKWIKQINVFYFRFFKVATLCLVDIVAHFWHFLNQLYEVVTNAMQFFP